MTNQRDPSPKPVVKRAFVRKQRLMAASFSLIMAFVWKCWEKLASAHALIAERKIIRKNSALCVNTLHCCPRMYASTSRSVSWLPLRSRRTLAPATLRINAPPSFWFSMCKTMRKSTRQPSGPMITCLRLTAPQEWKAKISCLACAIFVDR